MHRIDRDPWIDWVEGETRRERPDFAEERESHSTNIGRTLFMPVYRAAPGGDGHCRIGSVDKIAHVLTLAEGDAFK